MHPDKYAGTWVSRTQPIAYRVLPKCGCSSIGQVLRWIDHQSFFRGDIHDDQESLLRWDWNSPDNEEIAKRFDQQRMFVFTLVRNPYKRVLSSFADKIFSYQRDGNRYIGGQIHKALEEYGVEWGPESNVVSNFHGFVQFVADTILRASPMKNDMHWAPLYRHIEYSFWANPELDIHHIGHVENFERDLTASLDQAGVPANLRPASFPKYNQISLPELPIDVWYGPEQVDLMYSAFAADFNLFGYERDIRNTRPTGDIDAEWVKKALLNA